MYDGNLESRNCRFASGYDSVDADSFDWLISIRFREKGAKGPLTGARLLNSSSRTLHVGIQIFYPTLSGSYDAFARGHRSQRKVHLRLRPPPRQLRLLPAHHYSCCDFCVDLDPCGRSPTVSCAVWRGRVSGHLEMYPSAP